MQNVELKRGNTKTNQRDLYWQKSYIEFVPLEHTLIKLIVVTSYEYARTKLGIDPFNDFPKIDSWLTEQTTKFFEEFKDEKEKFPGDTIVRQFMVDPEPDLLDFIENEA